MSRPALIFEQSPLFLVVCIALGLVYAWLLYNKKRGPWSKRTNQLLFALRFVLAFIAAALLVSPVLKQIKNTVEPAKYVIAIDNSSSMGSDLDSISKNDLLNKLKALQKQKENDGYEVEYRTIAGERLEELPNRLTFDYQSSGISRFLDDIAFDYEGRNLGGVMLVSDGIYNQGISPTFKNYNYQINTLGVGDSVPKSDLILSSLVYNKISYQGNKFPVLVQFTQQGYDNRPVKVTLTHNGEIIDSKTVNLRPQNQLNEIRFLVEAKEKGFQRYTVSIGALEGELTYVNNTRQVYVEVIEGQENIAVIAAAPHPDIKALRFAIESNANYSFDQYILSLPEDVQRLQEANKKYDLYIFHQLPDKRRLSIRSGQYIDEKVPKLYVFGSQTDLSTFNLDNGVLALDALAGEYDNVNASFNQGFVSFNLSEKLQETFEELPPITVPFGQFNLKQGTRVLLYQKVGSIVTAKPLIAINDEISPKKAVVMGDGLWKWRLTSYVVNNNHEPFNELITKLVQFLSSKEDRRKFKAYPIKNEFSTNERVVFDTEVYNDLYERVYGNKIDLLLQHSEGETFSYSFITNENNTRYAISGLPEGVYTYTASTTLNGEKADVSGELVIKTLQIEDINLTADFGLLSKLAKATGGEFTYYKDFLPSEYSTKEAQGVIHSSEQYLPFIDLKWLFFVLLVLVSVEWFIRKYSGSY